MFFVLSLDPPIKQGQTRYHFLVLLFGIDEETSIELPFSGRELKEKYDDKLSKELSGPVYEVLGKIMKVIINRKLTGPGSFVGHSGTPAVSCSYKAAAGSLYPLERGFIYVHKPPMHIRFEEIACVNFARGGGSTKSFDFEIELKSGTNNTFSSIEKEEYAKLYDYVTQKKLTVKNTGKMTANYEDDFGDSDKEEPDAYLARVKAEAEERDSDESGSDEESTDEDFNPNLVESDVAEEFDSDPTTTDSDGDGADAGDGSKEKKKKEKKEKKEKVPSQKKPGPSSSKKEPSKKSKKDRDENKPKRAISAFMLWLNEHREEIKSENPGIKVTEIAKKGGEMWSSLKDKSEWEDKASIEKERYYKEKEEYKSSGKGEKRKKDAKPSPVKPSNAGSGGGYKSKEYISDDDSSSNDEKKDKKKKKSKKDESSESEGSD